MTDSSLSKPARLRVLIVDDNVDYANSLCEFLNMAAGWDASAAYTVSQAVAIARVHRPDAVLLDLRIPPETGFDAADAMQRLFPNNLPSIMAVSGSPELIEQARADTRFLDVVLKPADPAMLVQWLIGVASNHAAA
ncbi:response regulator [Piscinibacter terrae]|uniref:Response regulator n=1 Tax=Piscinibacter terrae TaxID=2496871 RepID=A0A3N7HPN0_9BURK|nr:response regulator [Albitalea terrae]RQP22701.1 response regulator [Albitalea terrae]